jgi:hypothetical protein
MDCASFERELTELLAGGQDDAERGRRLRLLRAHVEDCGDCAASRELLELWELPAAERDLAGDPGPDYWDGFEARVRARIAHDATVRRRVRGWWLAAAALLLVAAGVWSVGRLPTGPDRMAEASVERSAPLTADGTAPLPERLERELVAAPPGEAMAQVEDLARWGDAWEVEPRVDAVDAWDEGGLFPDVSDLDGEARQALLNWLKEQTT